MFVNWLFLVGCRLWVVVLLFDGCVLFVVCCISVLLVACGLVVWCWLWCPVCS